VDESNVEIEALGKIPFFAGMSSDEVQEVARLGAKVSFPEGSSIVEKGGPGDAMYVVLSGTAEVDVGGRFHVLKEGDFFGEMALLGSKRRMATVRATSPVEVLAISSDDFRAFLEAHPTVALGMLEAIVERLREVQDRLDAWIGS
jgi:CRP-like cAMP-binding protein